MVKCPQCGLEVPEIIPVDIDLRTRVKAMEPDLQILDEMCRSCVSLLRRKMTSSGGVLVAQEKAKEERKTKLWEIAHFFG